MKQHQYQTSLVWTGNIGEGTQSYRSYNRAYTISVKGKSDILGSSDPAFLGDASRHNPEEMLVMSLSSCHMLWYLHLCAEAGVIVIDYQDNAVGFMQENADGSGQFTKVVLHPAVKVKDPAMMEMANELHEKAHEMCFIARSCNFPVFIAQSSTPEA
ncbi:OsmC family protein [Taibaiella soli]|uniref:OsmC family peroxiredoxin n=1 Tax=Taibaiella soli TaxID=1649169 RepID=A0A2W2AQG4_9BACT|nr:OsmC family protein [Taibaiella soli]PZF74660.1 OsmC family peroxiredoxin [Taibaiella soli]